MSLEGMRAAMPLMTGPAQTLASVTKAELGKLLARGGIRRWVVAATIVGLAAGVLTILLNHDDGMRASINLTVAGSLSSGPLMVILVLGIAATNYVPREVSDGTIVTAKCLVPVRGPSSPGGYWRGCSCPSQHRALSYSSHWPWLCRTLPSSRRQWASHCSLGSCRWWCRR